MRETHGGDGPRDGTPDLPTETPRHERLDDDYIEQEPVAAERVPSDDAATLGRHGSDPDRHDVKDPDAVAVDRLADANGWRPDQGNVDLDRMAQSPEQLSWLAERKAVMGTTPEQYQECRSRLVDALERSGLTRDQFEIRAIGSAAHYYSSDRKPFDVREIEEAGAGERLRELFGDDPNYPAHHFFDSRYRLGLTDRPSDIDINISSDAMEAAVREQWEKVMNDRELPPDKRYHGKLVNPAWVAEYGRRKGRFPRSGGLAAVVGATAGAGRVCPRLPRGSASQCLGALPR